MPRHGRASIINLLSVWPIPVTQPYSALQILNTTFGYPSFRGPQADIIDHVGNGSDALVLMPTGGGKSLCYQIPALLREGVAIVVSPLIALMQDQVGALRELGLSASFLNSSLSGEDAFNVERQLMAGEIKLLYVAPERLLTARFLDQLDQLHAQNKVALFAIDEAHCVSQWGHDFRSDYLELAVLAKRFPGVPRIALTATADALTRTEIRLRLNLQDAREFVSSFDRPNIRYLIAERVDEREQLRAFLREHAGEAGIVYCLSRKKVDATAEWLNAEMTKALPYHAGMDQDVRRRNQSRFLREEGIVMVATIAFGMGIDKPDVRFVVHLDLPKSVEGYYQETGRAGRDGDDSEAMMIYGLADVVQQRRFIEQSDANDDFKRAGRAKLEALLGLCETTACRRGRLLSYFGELQPEGYACGNCDTCLSPPKMWDATELVRMALSAIYRTGQRFGATYVIEVLQGKTTTQIKERGHDTSPVHGIGKDHDEAVWRNVFRQIVTHGWAEIDVTAYGALHLTPAARAVLRGEVPAMLRQQLAVTATTKAAKAKRGTKVKIGKDGKVEAELTSEDEALYEKLKAWRLDTAREENVPAFVILHDSVLREIARSRPKDKSALAAISGIGESKLERFGETVVGIVED
jgi:ATP-dependent DNA helicase RecQ